MGLKWQLNIPVTATYLTHADRSCTKLKSTLAMMMYGRDNVQNAGHYRENNPQQGEPDTDTERSPVSCFALKGLFLHNDLILLITQLLAKTKKKILHIVCLSTINLLPSFVVLISREIVPQRR